MDYIDLLTSSVNSKRDPPPAFGHGMLKYFGFDPQYTNLNHGSFGATPTPVLEACDKLSAGIESNPDRFVRLSYHSAVNEARRRIARVIGAETDDCVLVPNVITGISTVLNNIDWSEGDILISGSIAYRTIELAASRATSASPYPKYSEFIINVPTSHASILSDFRKHIASAKKSLVSSPHSHGSSENAATKKPKIVAVFDSIASTPGVLLPWKEMVQICKREGVLSVVDAAHSCGQELVIDLASADPDFWATNCAKWFYAKRGCAVLYVPKRNQHIIRSTVLPALIFPSPKGEEPTEFVSQFYWSGTLDLVTPLSVCAAIEFRKFLGGEVSIHAYCHSLALRGGRRLAQIMGTSVMESPESEDELIACMVNVELPFLDALRPSGTISQTIQEKLLLEHKVFAPPFYHNQRWWIRASAQIYNEIGDFEKLGHACLEICRELVEEHSSSD